MPKHIILFSLTLSPRPVDHDHLLPLCPLPLPFHSHHLRHHQTHPHPHAAPLLASLNPAAPSARLAWRTEETPKTEGGGGGRIGQGVRNNHKNATERAHIPHSTASGNKQTTQRFGVRQYVSQPPNTPRPRCFAWLMPSSPFPKTFVSRWFSRVADDPPRPACGVRRFPESCRANQVGSGCVRNITSRAGSGQEVVFRSRGTGRELP